MGGDAIVGVYHLLILPCFWIYVKNAVYHLAFTAQAVAKNIIRAKSYADSAASRQLWKASNILSCVSTSLYHSFGETGDGRFQRAI